MCIGMQKTQKNDGFSLKLYIDNKKSTAEVL